MTQKIKIVAFAVGAVLFPVSLVYALSFETLFPISDITTQWNASHDVAHWTLVDDGGSCDEYTYVYTRANGAMEKYGYDLSGIPNGSVITAVDVYPCTGAWGGGRSSTSTLYVQPVLNGVAEGAEYVSFSSGSHPLQELGPYTWNVNVEKNDQTTLSMQYWYGGWDSDPQTIVLSRARVVITYVP